MACLRSDFELEFCSSASRRERPKGKNERHEEHRQTASGMAKEMRWNEKGAKRHRTQSAGLSEEYAPREVVKKKSDKRPP